MTKDYSYSRLNWTEERRLKKKALLFGGLSVLILLAFLFWGLPGIPRLLSFINWGSSKPLNLSADRVAPPPPFIFTPTIATSSAGFYLSGFVEPNSSVEVKFNGNLQPLVTSSSDGSFKSKRLELVEGKNSFFVVAIDEAGNKSQPSREFSIVLDKSKPEISLDQPQDGQRFAGSKQQSIAVSGNISKQAILTLNQRFLVVSGDGNFFSQIFLTPGGNALTLIATDSAGNTASKKFSVTFDP